MTWLLKLYPPQWRRRYGEEFLALIAQQRFSFATVFDIIGGAIDAWTQPQSHLAARAASQPEGDTIMLAKVMRLRCAGYGAKATAVDGLKGAGVILGGTGLSVLVAAWMRQQSVDPVYPQALMANGASNRVTVSRSGVPPEALTSRRHLTESLEGSWDSDDFCADGVTR